MFLYFELGVTQMTIDIVSLMLQIVIVAGIALAALFPKKFLGKYIEKKAENLATKEDIDEITRRIELVRAQIGREQAVLDAKYKLKHKACLDSLALIDAFYSVNLISPDCKQPFREEKTTLDARRCHSELILACENSAIVDKFLDILFRNKNESGFVRPPTDLLNEFRNLVRAELGFGDPIKLDREVAWFATFACDTAKSMPCAQPDVLAGRTKSGATMSLKVESGSTS